eukprot:scaffold7940_cov167-Amphora_coffeaeformis.AAC.3
MPASPNYSPYFNELIKDCLVLSQACYEDNPATYLNSRSHHFYDISVYKGEGKYILGYARNIFPASQEDRKYVVCAIRGSMNRGDWIKNACAAPAFLSGENQIHGGWYDRSDEIHDTIMSKIRQGFVPIFTGHSLGGAVARILLYRYIVSLEDDTSMFAQEFSTWPRAITFAAPAPFRHDLAREIDESLHKILFHNFFLEGDIVPHMMQSVHGVGALVGGDIMQELLKYESVGINIELPVDTGKAHSLGTISTVLRPFLQSYHSCQICDECKQCGLIGVRYNCESCEDYDLCKSCFDEESQHCHNHSFCKITEVGESDPVAAARSTNEGDESEDESELGTSLRRVLLYAEESDHPDVPDVFDCTSQPCTHVFNCIVQDSDALTQALEQTCAFWIKDFQSDLETIGIDGSFLDEYINVDAVVADAHIKFYQVVHRYSHKNYRFESAESAEKELDEFRTAALLWASNESVQDVRTDVIEKLEKMSAEHGERNPGLRARAMRGARRGLGAAVTKTALRLAVGAIIGVDIDIDA